MAGSGSIRKIDDQRWYVRIALGYDDEGKRQEHRHMVRGTKKDAQRYLTGVLRDIDLGRFAEPSKMCLSSYLKQWLEQAAKAKLKARTYQDYAEIVDKRIKPKLGGIAINQLTPMTVQAFYNELTARGLSAKTVRNTHVVLHSALKQAVRWRLILTNPAQDAELPRRVRREMSALDSVQAHRFVEATKKFPKGIAYLVGLGTGMRPGEYLALKWSDVNLATGEIRVQRSLFWPRGGGWRFEEPKTPKSRRTVILPTKLAQQLREHGERQVEYRAQVGELYQNHNLVFANEWGGPLEACNLNKRTFKEILKLAGLPPTLRPYDLRHSAATLLLEQGMNPKIVAEQLGHASVTMTMDVYSHVTPTMQQAAADKLDRFF